MDPTYPLVPVANFLACILVLISLSKSTFQSWNVGVCSFAIWVAIVGFTTALDSILWARSVNNLAPVYCDIVTHLQIGSTTAIPTASLVIIRRLSVMMRQRDSTLEKNNRWNLRVDLLLCLGVPSLVMALYYIVQITRFGIIEEYGCISVSVNAGLALLLIDSVPLVFSLISLILYTPRLIWVYFKHRQQDEFLASNSPLDRRSFMKVLALGLFDILITFPIAIFKLVLPFVSNDGITSFWPGWRAAHSEFNFVPMATSDEWASFGFGFVATVRIGQWINPLFAIVFFSLFGLTENNRLWYRNLFWKFMRPFGFMPRPNPEASTISFGSGPLSGTGTSGVTASADQLSTSESKVMGRTFGVAAGVEDRTRKASCEARSMVATPSLRSILVEEV